MVNICSDCKAVREYPSGKRIVACPRCGSLNIKHKPSPATQPERDELLLAAIRGDE